MIGIIGAMDEEVALLRAAMDEGAAATKRGVFTFMTGRLEGQEVTLLRCGIGKVNAAVGCAILIDTFKPRFVINTGSAGGIDPALRVGDLIISDGLLYHDVDVTAFGYPPGQIPGQPVVFPVPEDLIRRAEEALRELKAENALPGDLRAVRGVIGSADVFLHDPVRTDAARRLFPAMRAVEMEGAAVAHAAALFGVPALIIRALSDVAGQESSQTFDEFLPVAARHSARLVQRILRRSPPGAPGAP